MDGKENTEFRIEELQEFRSYRIRNKGVWHR
jgi:hypothetical protein